jgi:UDP-N-acetylmuramoylalanine--D-glutamate ligase
MHSDDNQQQKNIRNKHSKVIGIWGFGIVGKAIACFLHEQGTHLAIMDNRPLTNQEQQWLQERNIPFFSQQGSIDIFLEHYDYIIPSPGIDIRTHYKRYKHKWIMELDLFTKFWKKPVIAITGSIGKTTVTSCISQLLSSAGKKICTGGNIGVGSLDLIKEQNYVEYAVLEVADVQLRYTKQFSPDVAIWTNFYPNHLNWHDSLQDYFRAKANILAHQHKAQHALVPASLVDTIKQYIQPQSLLHIFTTQPITKNLLHSLDKNSFCFGIQDGVIIAYNHSKQQELCSISQLAPVTFIDNWLVLVATCFLLKIPLNYEHISRIIIPEHRLEKVATVATVTFYNDSKSTIGESTRAALEQLNHTSVILFLGGLSKGVDRTPFIKELAGKVKKIYCFGTEARNLAHACTLVGITAMAFTTLDDAFIDCIKNLEHQDMVLFSPAGSSQDLFKDYQERGNYFKQLVYTFASRINH